MDPYKVLGVANTASDDEIRKAFRQLAKELHPDLNPNDSSATDRFKQVSAAYELLGDPQKRRAFDRGEIDASGEPRGPFATHGMGAGAGGFGGGFGRGGQAGSQNFGFHDIFEDLFGSAGKGFEAGRTQSRPQARGADVRYTLQVDFLEAVNGAKKRVTLPEGGVLDLKVPAGVDDSQVLRLRGKGSVGPLGGEAGDALVEIKVRSHKAFRREGKDIFSEVPISIDEAILGGKVEVITIGGRVQLSIPAGTNSGRVFRLKGKGVAPSGGAAGDHMVSVKIVLPETLDEDLKRFFESWREKNAYNPGRQ